MSRELQRKENSQHKCALHPSSFLAYFCESCNDAVCQICTNKQPHSGPNHNIIDLEQAANLRKNSYVNFLTTFINSIRTQAQQRIRQLEEIRKSQQLNKQVIHKDIKVEFQSIKSRSQNKASNILTQIHIQIKHYQMYIQQLDDLYQTFYEAYDNPQTFLISYSGLHKQIKKLQAIDFKAQKVDRNKWDDRIQSLPRELPQIYNKIDNLKLFQDKNQFVNKLIQSYLKYYHQKIKDQKANSIIKAKRIKHTYNSVLQNLVISQNMAKLCVFCGQAFSLEAVNDGCSSNRTYKVSPIYSGPDWTAIIPNFIRGSKQHFWYTVDLQHRKRPDLQAHSIVRKKMKKHYLNSLQQLECIKFYLRKHQIDCQKTYEKVFEANDGKNSGYVSKVAFHYNMAKVYKIPQCSIQGLIDLLYEQQKGVNYLKIRQIVDNPTQDYFKFQKQEEQLQKSKPVAPASYSKFRY